MLVPRALTPLGILHWIAHNADILTKMGQEKSSTQCSRGESKLGYSDPSCLRGQPWLLDSGEALPFLFLWVSAQIRMWVEWGGGSRGDGGVVG